MIEAGPDRATAGPDERIRATPLRAAWPYVRPVRTALVGALVLSLLGAAATLVQPLLVATIVDSFGSGVPIGTVAVLGGLLVVSALLTCAQQLMLERSSERLVFAVRKELLGRILRLPIGVLERRARGDLVSRVTSDAAAIRDALSQGIVELGANAVTVVAALVMMALIDPVLLLVVVGVVIVLVVVTVLIGSRTRGAALDLQRHVGLLSTRVERALGGVRTIRATRSTGREVDRSVQQAGGALAAGLRVAWLKAVLSSFAGLAVQVILLAVVGVGALRVAAGVLSVGQLGAFVMYVMLIVAPVSLFAGIVASLNRAMGAFARVREVVDLPVESELDPVDPAVVPNRPGASAFRFRDVSFRYDEDAAWAARNVELDIRARSVTAIVGPSGAGKSTMFGLMERFYDPVDGTIEFLGADVTSLSRDDVRAHIAYVEQDAPALAGTIRDNLLLGSHEATDADCIGALRRSNLIPGHMSTAQFLDTEVGENGVLLSGGERQRLAIARALLSDVGILLLDEATSNLDSNNEYQLRRAIERFGEDRTVVVIAHRLSTAVGADRIVVMDGGRIVGEGDHGDLLRTSSLYRELARHQRLDRLPGVPDGAEDHVATTGASG